MFSELLKRLRSEKGLSQAQLAEAAGVSPGNVGDWERGKSKPGYNALAALTRIFEVSADYLLELSTTPERTIEGLDEYKEAQGLVCDGSALRDAETDLVAMFRLLPSREQEDAFDYVYFKYKKFVEQKKMSIFWTYAEGRKSGGINTLLDDEKSAPA